ncbi:MAG: UTP--glucose-1-phosphate uridylyltransferase GalU [Gammaproteobacteria bacterium]|jgi:UTP--glucose-1-phosphate uridylyltransferase
MQKIRTAVFPVAGRGTRFLPATKASPKEMLPIVDKPLIQYAVEEAIAAGAEKLVFVTGATKRAIEDHFDVDADLERALELSGKNSMLRRVRDIVPSDVKCVYIRQGTPQGLGHAVLCARPVVGEEPFFVHLADDLIYSEVPVLKQMSEEFERHGSSVLGVETVPPDQTGSYGIVELAAGGNGDMRIRSIVEKPAPEDAPSNLGVVGRYVLTPRIFDLLESTAEGAGGEIQLTDAIAALLEYEDVYAYPFSGTRYDCGSKLGYLRASVEYGLRHPDLGSRFREYLHSIDTA